MFVCFNSEPKTCSGGKDWDSNPEGDPGVPPWAQVWSGAALFFFVSGGGDFCTSGSPADEETPASPAPRLWSRGQPH